MNPPATTTATHETGAVRRCTPGIADVGKGRPSESKNADGRTVYM